MSEKLIKLEDRSRRNNLPIDGIKEEPGETWEACEKKIQNIIANKLGIESDVEIDRHHRIGPCKTKIGIRTNHAPLFAELTDLRISNTF